MEPDLELATTEQLVSELFKRFDLACFAGRKRRQSCEINGGEALLTTHGDVQAIKSGNSEDIRTVIDNLHGDAFAEFLESIGRDDREDEDDE